MTAWTVDGLRRIARVDELEVASRRPDGSLRPFVTIWFVAHDGDVDIRSAHGPDNGWFRRAREQGAGRVRIGSVEKELVFEPAPDARDAVRRGRYAWSPTS